MDVGELVAFTMPYQFLETECPFSHEKPKDQEENELGGIGTKLGDNMAAGKGVSKSKPPDGPDFTIGSKEPDPRQSPRNLLSIRIQVNKKYVTLNGKPLKYPLTCAAHHLIPAQESLKGNSILKFMCKDGVSQDFRNSGGPAPAAVPDAVVWGNVAYNVNGSHNGVWLPGNYAVGAGVGGVGVWVNRLSGKEKTITDREATENCLKKLDLDLAPEEWAQLSSDPQEEEGPASLAKALNTASKKEFMLAGKNYNIDEGNPKWAYVKAAMEAAGGQFHDRHEQYSIKVKEYLEKIAATYQQMYDHSVISKTPCAKCKEARVPSGAKDSLVGPPYGIVGRLVAGSRFFKNYLATSTITTDAIFTSKWVQAWVSKVRQEKAKIK